MAITLKLLRDGAVGFIVLLDPSWYYGDGEGGSGDTL
jgi:hypothetical protein